MSDDSNRTTHFPNRIPARDLPRVFGRAMAELSRFVVSWSPYRGQRILKECPSILRCWSLWRDLLFWRGGLTARRWFYWPYFLLVWLWRPVGGFFMYSRCRHIGHRNAHRWEYSCSECGPLGGQFKFLLSNSNRWPFRALMHDSDFACGGAIYRRRRVSANAQSIFIGILIGLLVILVGKKLGI